MPETLTIEDLATKLAALEVAAFALLAALEGGNPDEIAVAKRRLGLVLADT